MELFEKLGIDWRLITVQIINFAIVLYLLKRFLYKPVLGILEKRRKEVEQSVVVAEKIKKERTELEEKIERELAKAKKEAHDIVSSADDAAAKMTATKTAEARLQAEKIVEDAKAAMEQEKASILDEVRDDVVKLVVGGTEKLLGKSVKGQKAFVQSSLKKLKK